MIQVNLVSKKRKQAREKNWTIIGVLGGFAVFVLYFLGMTVYVLVQLYIVNTNLSKVSIETEAVSKEMLASNKQLSDFILSKYILTKIETINKDKFRYKDYMDQIAGFLPEGVVLKNVDFAVKGWVSVLVQIGSVNILKQFENRIYDQNALTQSLFSTVFVESVAREQTGTYAMKLQFEIRKNGR